jgi:hypothetical protein
MYKSKAARFTAKREAEHRSAQAHEQGYLALGGEAISVR